MSNKSYIVHAQGIAATNTIPVLVMAVAMLLAPISIDAAGQARPVPSVLEEPFVRQTAQKGLASLYDLDFERATVEFTKIDRRHPDHPIGPFLLSLTTWWEILLDLNDRSHDDAFYKAMDDVIERCDVILRKDDKNVDAMFFKGAALGFRGRLRSNRGDWFKSAMDGKKAMDYVLGVPELDPNNHDYQFGKGLYDYFAAVIPQQYPFVKPVMTFFPDGDRIRGLELIARTADSGYYIQTEAAYFLVQIYFLYEKDYQKCLKYLTWLRERYPNNAYFHALEGRIYANWGQWSKSKELFDGVLSRYVAGDRGYTPAIAEQALYFRARALMIERKHADALGSLIQLEALAARSKEDTYFKVWGRLRQGMCYDILEKRSMAEQRYREVKKMTTFGSSQDLAKRYLERPFR